MLKKIPNIFYFATTIFITSYLEIGYIECLIACLLITAFINYRNYYKVFLLLLINFLCIYRREYINKNNLFKIIKIHKLNYIELEALESSDKFKFINNINCRMIEDKSQHCKVIIFGFIKIKDGEKLKINIKKSILSFSQLNESFAIKTNSKNILKKSYSKNNRQYLNNINCKLINNLEKKLSKKTKIILSIFNKKNSNEFPKYSGAEKLLKSNSFKILVLFNAINFLPNQLLTAIIILIISILLNYFLILSIIFIRYVFTYFIKILSDKFILQIHPMLLISLFTIITIFINPNNSFRLDVQISIIIGTIYQIRRILLKI